jgi:hypothetical protein
MNNKVFKLNIFFSFLEFHDKIDFAIYTVFTLYQCLSWTLLMQLDVVLQIAGTIPVAFSQSSQVM